MRRSLVGAVRPAPRPQALRSNDRHDQHDPVCTSLIVANFLDAALYAVLAAAGRQFLGLGDPASSSWGTMLYWAENRQAALQLHRTVTIVVDEAAAVGLKLADYFREAYEAKEYSG